MGATGLPGWASALPSFEVGGSVATRKANSQVLNAIGDVVPSIISGSADLTGNTGTDLKAAPISAAEPGGRLMYYGVREHAMGSIANGMALHGGVLPVVGTFLVFSDYMRPAVRMAALSGAKVAFVWSHDSVGVGEDGPTHQPVEHVAALRTIPGLPVFRPADANEVAQAWQVVVDGDGPAALILTRQNVPTLAGTQIAGQVARGGYALSAPENPAVVLAATGSEVHLCVDAAAALAADGIVAQVVSLPCWELFDQQEAAYRDQVLPEGVPVVGVEAGVSLGWDQYADATITIDRFGASAPGDEVMERLGFTADNVANIARTLIG
jgi:transketolase